MTTQIQRRRGTTTEHGSFTGAVGEITIDTTKDTVVVHDGSTAGGHPLAKENNPTFTGNVGIGTSSPSQPLTVNGVSRFENFIEFGGSISTPATAASIYRPADNNLAFGTASTERLRIDSSGHLNFRQESASSPYPEQKLKWSNDSTTTSGFYISQDTGRNGRIWHEQGLEILFGTSNTERMRLDVNGNLGIGSSSPTSYANSQKTLVIEDSGNPAICWSDTGQTRDWWAIASGSALSFKYADGGGSSSASNVTNVLQLDNSGNIGIGTTSPESFSNLHIEETSGNAVLLLEGSDRATIILADNTGGTNNKNLFIRNDEQNLLFGHFDDSFGSADERMRIDSNGRLLIGTSTARATGGSQNRYLQVEGTTYATAGLSLTCNSTSQNAGLNFGRSRGTSAGSSTAVQDGDILGFITWSAADGTDLTSYAAYIHTEIDGTPGSNNTPGRLVFSTTAPGNAASSERLTIDSSGRVGVGTNSPGQLLHLSSASPRILLTQTSASSNAFLDAATSGVLEFSADDNNVAASSSIRFKVDGSEKVRIDSSGNVGIGTSSPNAALQVGETSVNSARGIRIKNNDNTGTAVKAQLELLTNQGTSTIGATNSGNIILSPAGGKVGIGTTSPIRPLSVSNSGAEGFEFGPGDTAGTNLTLHYNRSTSAYIGSVNQANYHTWSAGGASEKMRLDSSGNLGIGTSSPLSELHVESATSAHITVRTASSNMAQFGSKGDDVYIGGTSGSADVVFKKGVTSNTHPANSGTETVRITSGGHVDIGANSGSASGEGFYLQKNGGGYIFTSSALNALNIYQSGTKNVEINSSGTAYFADNVGIGDSNPGGRLDIGFNSNSEVGLVLSNAGTGTSARFYSGSSIVGSITVTGSATAYNTSSDYRLKENVVDIADGITRVKQLQPKRFNFIADAETTVDGFLAHEAQTVVPEAVTGTHNEVDDDGNAVMQGIDQSKLVPLLTAALQEAIAKIETLEAKVAALEAG